MFCFLGFFPLQQLSVLKEARNSSGSIHSIACVHVSLKAESRVLSRDSALSNLLQRKGVKTFYKTEKRWRTQTPKRLQIMSWRGGGKTLCVSVCVVWEEETLKQKTVIGLNTPQKDHKRTTLIQHVHVTECKRCQRDWAAATINMCTWDYFNYPVWLFIKKYLVMTFRLFHIFVWIQKKNFCDVHFHFSCLKYFMND